MHFAAILVYNCSYVDIIGVKICNPKGYGILALDVAGKIR